MTAFKIWQLYVKPHEEITACYAKICNNYKPLKCRCMVLMSNDKMVFYHSSDECEDGRDYVVANVTMLTATDNYFNLWVEVK